MLLVGYATFQTMRDVPATRKQSISSAQTQDGCATHLVIQYSYSLVDSFIHQLSQVPSVAVVMVSDGAMNESYFALLSVGEKEKTT